MSEPGRSRTHTSYRAFVQTWMHRLRRLEWDEILTRGRQGLDKRLDWARYRWGAPFRVSRRELNADDSPRFFFDATQAAACARLIASELPSDAEEIVARADRICRYEFDLLGWERIRFGDEIDWHLDPVHGKRALRAPWHRIPFLDFETVGDAKIIWELNRHQHFVTLAKASLLTGNNAYVEELVPGPAFPVGKIPFLEMWGECSDEIVGEGVYVSSEGHRFPASGVLAETEAVLAATERRKTGDGPVFVGVDVQMASLGTDADMFVVSKGVNSITQLLGLLVGRFAHRGALAGFHTTSSGSFFELDARL